MLRDALVKCFVKRLPKIYANSNNVVKETMSKYMSILTKSEQQCMYAFIIVFKHHNSI